MEKVTMPVHTEKKQNVFAQSKEDTLSQIAGKQQSPNCRRHYENSYVVKHQMQSQLEPSDSAQFTPPHSIHPYERDAAQRGLAEDNT